MIVRGGLFLFAGLVALAPLGAQGPDEHSAYPDSIQQKLEKIKAEMDQEGLSFEVGPQCRHAVFPVPALRPQA